MWIHRHLFATCSSGMCNRLLVLAGCQRIADQTQRSLALYWPVNEALGCQFDELFTNQFEMVTEEALAHILKTNFNVKVYNAWRTNGPTYRTIRRDGDPDADIVIIKGWSHPRFEDETHSPEIDADVRRRLLKLQPRPEIQARADAITFDGPVFGVHIRRGDCLEVFGKSREEHFFRLMEGVRQRCPAARFFLATDVAEVEARFHHTFPGLIVSAPKRWAPRHEREGVWEGLIDLLLLARTVGIIGTTQSSFSQTAERIGGIPLIVADELNAGPLLPEASRMLALAASRSNRVPGSLTARASAPQPVHV
jgi:hypothetical protein